MCGICVWVEDDFQVCFFFLLFESWELNSGHQVWQQVNSLIEPYCKSLIFIIVFSEIKIE